ncbi:short-chain fatty acyl-CoA regulator family protein [Ahrensia kielensis]|uniref:Short-chain fatty acyl-CoA regulator family protein n=1 Tax=Ahrensia kielensis TaxID=76980 RepID=A0ABU9T2X1_9HYPH
MRERKLFIGQNIRSLRDKHGHTQAEMAARLSISTSYLNQIENNQRHVTASVLLSLAEVFSIDIASLSDNDSDRLLADLLEALADPLFKAEQLSSRDLKTFSQTSPIVARAFLNMHQALRRAGERLAQIDDSLERSGALSELTPYEEVRDFFHYNDNYIDSLDRAGEALAQTLSKIDRDMHQALTQYLFDQHQVRVYISDDVSHNAPIRRYDPAQKLLTLSNVQSQSSRIFQMAHQIAFFEQAPNLDRIAQQANFRSPEAADICRIGLANYFSGATLLPYERFAGFAVDVRHDLHIMARHFGASIEQVAHRLSTLQRSGRKGVPFFFARVDQAGNITKRHSATKLQFARFGSTCPLWNAHAAFEAPGRILRQKAETPDGVRYLCLATEVTNLGAGFNVPAPRYALALGCEIKHAAQLVYADGLEVGKESAFDPIGISCRICPRSDCHQRAVPPLQHPLSVDLNERVTIPYTF